MSKRITILNNYLSTKGGGERSTLQFAYYFSEKISNSEVRIITFEPEPPTIGELANFFKFPDSKNIKILKYGISQKNFLFRWLSALHMYFIIFRSDIFLNHSHDPSLFPLAKRNYNLIMFPFNAYYGRRPFRFLRKKLTSLILPYYDLNFTNSEFTRQECIKAYGNIIKFSVIYPYFDFNLEDNTFESSNETFRNSFQIVNVSRFSRTGHSKNQDLLLEAFKILIKIAPNTQFKIKFLGSLDNSKPDDVQFFKELILKANGMENILIVHNATHEELQAALEESDFFWLGTGFSRDKLKLYPVNYEHFGIALIEAMAKGIIPLAPNKGGPIEILNDIDSNLLIVDSENLAKETFLLALNKERRNTIRKKIFLKVKSYSKEEFENKLYKTLLNLGT